MFSNIIETAFHLIFTLDKDLLEIISLSLRVTLSALVISIIISIPFGAFLVFYKNKFQRILLYHFSLRSSKMSQYKNLIFSA